MATTRRTATRGLLSATRTPALRPQTDPQSKVAEVVRVDLLERARQVVSDAPYRIKDGGRGVIVWEAPADGGWREIATFLRREDAEAFVFVMASPVLGDWT